MFRGKESSNRIELSRLVQYLLNFGVLGSLRLWGWRGWVYADRGWLGVPPHMCTHTRMHAHTRTHIYTLNMIISIANGSPHWGNSWQFPMMSYACVCACMCMCRYVGGILSPPPLPSTHPHPPRGTLRIIQNSIALELIEIFQFCLKI